MKIVKIQVICSHCGHEWWARGSRQQNCPSCYVPTETGWTKQLEEQVLRRSEVSPRKRLLHYI